MSAPVLTKANAAAVDRACQHLTNDNPGAFARAVSALHRASNLRQQAALDAVIAETGTAHLFTRRNGALITA